MRIVFVALVAFVLGVISELMSKNEVVKYLKSVVFTMFIVYLVSVLIAYVGLHASWTW